MTFYRYVRPLEYDHKKCRVETPARGGLCFRVELDELGEKKVATASYSICPMTEDFDKAVARKIADTRFVNGHVYTFEVESVATHMIARKIVELAQHILETPGAPLEAYKRADLELLIYTYQSICESHRRTWEVEALTHETIKALNIESRYAKTAR